MLSAIYWYYVFTLLSTPTTHLYNWSVYVRKPDVLAKIQHDRRSGIGEMQTVCLSCTDCLSCVGKTILSSMSRQSFFTCSLFLMLYQYWTNDIFSDSQSQFLTKLTSGLKFLSFRVAAAMKLTPRFSENFFCAMVCLPPPPCLFLCQLWFQFPPKEFRGWPPIGFLTLWLSLYLIASPPALWFLGPRGWRSICRFRCFLLKCPFGWWRLFIPVLFELSRGCYFHDRWRYLTGTFC